VPPGIERAERVAGARGLVDLEPGAAQVVRGDGAPGLVVVDQQDGAQRASRIGSWTTLE
jgi:hypothetical protein